MKKPPLVVSFLFLAACQVSTSAPLANPSASASAGAPSAHTSSSSPGYTYEPAKAPVATPDAPFVGSTYHLHPGDLASTEPDTCDGAHDHCLPAEAVFVQVDDDQANVALRDAGGKVIYDGYPVPADEPLLTTERATHGNVHPGSTVLVYGNGNDVPESEAQAMAKWQIRQVESIEGDTLHLTEDSTFEQDVQIGSCRAVKN